MTDYCRQCGQPCAELDYGSRDPAWQFRHNEYCGDGTKGCTGSMTKIDFSRDMDEIFEDVLAAVAGAECVALVSPAAAEMGYIVLDDEELPELCGDDIVVTLSRRGHSDARFAYRLVSEFQTRI